ncbi:signal transduction histidine kinase [Luteibacter rhizovicinus]|uniref:histidine kinase n=1 Tax=Luteibacter rhizovicinus TaxID=242606 RepID=A0A4R3YV57_9GAMM|nr:ATP-binding protein [Luteibacter rhizovicinus]TCV95688.1 signal transduction histidine kinase [Luteibacter rhizovicinus]
MPRLLPTNGMFALAFGLIASGLISSGPISSASAVDVSAPRPTPQFRSYGLAQGLPSSEVYSVAQDSRGFLWIGTATGLARFDGVRFETRARDGSGPAATSATTGLLVDSNGRVWTGSGSGLQRHDVSENRTQRWQHDPDDTSSLSDDDVTSLAQTLDGSLWIGTAQTGLNRMRADGSGFERFGRGHVGDGPASDIVTSLFADIDGRLWIGSPTGVDVMDTDDRFHAVRFADDGPHRVNRIDGDASGPRIATDRGLYRVDANGVAHRDNRLPAVPIDASLADSHGLLWVATAMGLHLLDRHGRVHPLPALWTARGGLPGRTVRQILEDDEHGIWFAQSDGGLAYIGPSWDDFTRFSHIPTDAASLPGRTVTAIAAHGADRLWVGGMRGWIRRFDPVTGRAEGTYDVGTSRIQALHEGAGERLWVGTANGLHLRESGQVRSIAPGRIDRAVTAIAEVPDGRVFAAVLARGVFVIDPQSLAVSRVAFAVPARGNTETLQLEFVGGKLWHASTAGLARWDDATATLRPVDGVSKGRVNAFELHEGGFWLARPDALEHYAIRNGVAVLDRAVTATDGWPSPDILNLRLDSLGRLWVYGPTGVWRFDPGTGRFRPFGEADGLSSGEFTNGTTVMLPDGTMYGATLSGLVGFRPDRQSDHARRPPVEVAGASVARGGTRVALPIVDDTIRLGWNDRDVRIAARVLSYVDPSANSYTFSLETAGHATSLSVGASGIREFAHLGAGTYRLSISGAARDGVRGELARPLTVIVDAAPWLRWWAWTSYVLVALAIVVALVVASRRRLHQSLSLQFADQRRRLAEEANEAKTDFMATLGHEIRTPMTGVLGMAELMGLTSLTATQRSYVDALTRSGELLLRLVNEALDLTRIESRRLVLETTCLSTRDIVAEVVMLARVSARHKNLLLESSFSPDVPGHIRGDGTRIRQILQNLLGNAVKFTDAGAVTLAVSRDADHLIFDVTDTGPGISDALRTRLFRRFEQGASPQRALGSGLGLSICRELALLMGGRIDVVPGVEGGTRFRVRLPLVECSCANRSPRPFGLAHGDTTNPVSVLMVEDDPTVADVIGGLLRERGHDVTHVVDGLAALAELPCRRYDLMLLDLDLPGIDGFQVARLVRRMDHYATLPIVAVSARSIGDEADATREAGMNGFVRKPVRGTDLDQVIAQWSHAAA